MAEIKPAYLVHGDDDVMLDARREGIRNLVAQDDTAELHVLRHEKLSVAAVVDELCFLTLGTGRRWIVADGVQDWKEKDVGPVAEALQQLGDDTVVVFVAEAKPK